MNRTIARWFFGLVGLMILSTWVLAQAPVLVWRFYGNPAPNNPASPNADDKTAYFPCLNKLYAVNLEDGTLKWQYPADGTLDTTFLTRPLAGKEFIYVGTGNGNLIAIDRETGRLRWSFSARSAITGSPVMDDENIYFGTGNGEIYALNMQSGQPAWQKPFKAGDYIYGQILKIEDFLIFSSNDGSLYAVAAAGGAGRWKFAIPSPSYDSQPAIGNEMLYVVGNSRLYALDYRSKMSLRSPRSLGGDPRIGITADENGVYGLTHENKIYAFDHAGNAPFDLKKAPILEYAPLFAPVAAGGWLWIATRRGTLYAYDLQTAELRWAYTIRPMPGATAAAGTRPPDYLNISRPPLPTPKGLLVTCEDGSLHLFSADWVDRTPPEASELIPFMGEMMSGQLPFEASVRLRDDGSGVNAGTIQILLDDQVLEHKYEQATGLATVNIKAEGTSKPIPDGRHTMTVIATDWAGNTLRRSWGIYIDNGLRKVRRTNTNQPPGGTPGAPPGGRGGGDKGGGY
jgi:outer membrane protein assembly factor BamB